MAASVENRVAAHYTTDTLLERIKDALVKLGVDLKAMRPEDLKPVDEFHTGGREATEALLAQLDISPATRVLDIGSGLGGTARLIAATYGASVTGVDLTPVFVQTATELSHLVGLNNKTTFQIGSAVDLPVPDAAFDLTLLLHVGMNIADKAALFREARRVLRAGGTFAVFDVMRGPELGALTFPFPWAEEAAFSFVEPPSAYRAAANDAGFTLVAERDRSDFALDYIARAFASIEKSGPSPLGIHLMMRDTARLKLENYVNCVRAGLIKPVEMIFHAA
jgi:SAM-dependent methyltransferase